MAPAVCTAGECPPCLGTAVTYVSGLYMALCCPLTQLGLTINPTSRQKRSFWLSNERSELWLSTLLAFAENVLALIDNYIKFYDPRA